LARFEAAINSGFLKAGTQLIDHVCHATQSNQTGQHALRFAEIAAIHRGDCLRLQYFSVSGLDRINLSLALLYQGLIIPHKSRVFEKALCGIKILRLCKLQRGQSCPVAPQARPGLFIRRILIQNLPIEEPGGIIFRLIHPACFHCRAGSLEATLFLFEQAQAVLRRIDSWLAWVYRPNDIQDAPCNIQLVRVYGGVGLANQVAQHGVELHEGALIFWVRGHLGQQHL
jgi:hypothetical protein